MEIANRPTSGLTGLIELRHIPGSFAIMTAAISAVTAQQWANLRTLVVTSSTPNRYDGAPLDLLEATDLFRAFSQGGSADAMLSYAARKGISIPDVVTELGGDKHMTNSGAAAAQWAFHALRPLFADQIPDPTDWETKFNRAELFLGVLAEDAYLRRPVPENGHRYRLSHWIGRAVNNYRYAQRNPVNDWAFELERDGANWGPLKAGLFGGDGGRASLAMSSFAGQFNRVAEQRY